MAAKQPTSVSLTAEQREAIKEAQQRLAKSGIKPSMGDVMRASMDLGLPLLVEGASRGNS
jgi:hypothetical protein